MKKPDGCIFPDCFGCLLDDCMFDKEEQEEEIMLEIGELDVFLANLKATKREGESLRNNKMYKKAINRKEYLLRKIFSDGYRFED